MGRAKREGDEGGGNEEKKVKRAAYTTYYEEITVREPELEEAFWYSKRPPPGFTFVPFGQAEFTARCKQLCRKNGMLVVNVHIAAPDEGEPRNASLLRNHRRANFQTNRFGYCFPDAVVDAVVEERRGQGSHTADRDTASIVDSIELARRALATHRRRSDSSSSSTPRRNSAAHPVDTKHVTKAEWLRMWRNMHGLAHAAQMEHAMRLVEELFPRMDQQEAWQMIDHAWHPGRTRVGTASDLSIDRRVQLAVAALVRHSYTGYDNLLSKNVERSTARKYVEADVVHVMRELAGDNHNRPATHTEWRQVIVIADEVEDREIKQEEREAAGTNADPVVLD